MYPFVPTVLIRSPRGDALRQNSQAIHQTASRDRPDGASDENGGPLSVWITSGRPNSRKTRSKVRCTGPRSVRSNPRQHSKVAAERIGNRQRMAALPSAWKMPFEVGTPNPVRGITRCQAVRVGFASTHSPALSRHQAPFAKYLADRARHRQRNPRMVPFENHEQLTWPPSGVLLTRSHHELHDVRAHSTGVRVWCSGLVRQRFRPPAS